MFKIFKKFSNKKSKKEASEYSKEEVLLVSASLAYEVAKADGKLGQIELKKIKEHLEDVKRHLNKDVANLFNKIENKSNKSISFYDLVKLVNDRFSLDQKNMLLRFLWDIAYADKILKADEERLIRRIADLLSIKDIKVLRLKNDARTSSNN
jgi:uncharacterized tellurite resistance protein B-like protein